MIYVVILAEQAMAPHSRSVPLLKIFALKHGSPTGEGDGTPLQYSCLENPMDGGAR